VAASAPPTTRGSVRNEFSGLANQSRRGAQATSTSVPTFSPADSKIGMTNSSVVFGVSVDSMMTRGGTSSARSASLVSLRQTSASTSKYGMPSRSVGMQTKWTRTSSRMSSYQSVVARATPPSKRYFGVKPSQ
jgi:hypothetical protein